MRTLKDLQDLIKHAEKCLRDYNNAEVAYRAVQESDAPGFIVMLCSLSVKLPKTETQAIILKACEDYYNQYSIAMDDLGIEEREPFFMAGVQDMNPADREMHDTFGH